MEGADQTLGRSYFSDFSQNYYVSICAISNGYGVIQS
jgi:hypothetical protein